MKSPRWPARTQDASTWPVRAVIPGILDTHNHYSGDPLPNVANINFGEFAPACARVLEVLERTVRKLPAGTLITGSMGPDAFLDPACTPALPDRIAPSTRCSC